MKLVMIERVTLTKTEVEIEGYSCEHGYLSYYTTSEAETANAFLTTMERKKRTCIPLDLLYRFEILS